MSLSDLQVLLGLLALIAVFPFVAHPPARRALVAACSLLSLYLLLPGWGSWAVLFAFVLSGYGAAMVVRRWRRPALLAAYVAGLVLAFLVLRRYEVVTVFVPETLLARVAAVTGISYILFRQIHFVVDVYEEQIERPSLWAYLNYQLSFLTIVSGPIQRFQDFDAQWQTLVPDRGPVQAVFFRLMLGYAKLVLVAPLFLGLDGRFKAALLSGTAGDAAVLGSFAGLVYAFPIYLYLNFSGYCDVVIAVGAFLGFQLPENFQKPYLARNVIDYWTRFHRTLGFWIRDYLFLPLYKAIASRAPKRAEQLAFLCYFVAFFLAGVWHGPTANFVVYGLLQAVGVSAAKLWERHLLKRRGRPGLKAYMQSRRVRTVAIVATLHFEFLSLLFFPNDLDTVGRIARAVSGAVL